MQPNVMMRKPLRFLVGSEAAERFLELAATPSGARAFVGDGGKFRDGAASAALLNAATALREGVHTVERLALDKTRLPPSAHEAARRVANGVMDMLSTARTTVVARSKALYDSAHGEADMHFRPNLERGALDSEIRTWIRSEAARPEGISKVRELLSTDPAVGSVIWHSPSFLLGIQEDLHTEYRYTVMQKFLPDAYGKVAESLELQNIAPKLDAAIASVKTSFYSPGIAAEAATRVEV